MRLPHTLSCPGQAPWSPALSPCRGWTATSRRRASAPLQPAREVDDHRRRRPPDPAPVPHYRVLVTLLATAQCRLPAVVREIEQVTEWGFDPARDFTSVWREWRMGRYYSE